MGADIAKVENPKGGEAGRTGFGDAYYFMMYNANKRSVTINLKSDRGLALVKQMATKADVFAENFAPGAIERLGLGYDVVSAINPGIIYAQIKGFGDGSPYEKGLAFDPIAQAAGGAMSVTGERDGRPVKPGPTIGDTGTGMVMAFSIVSALFDRARTGKGRRLQVAMQDLVMHYSRGMFITQARTGAAAPRRPPGNNPPSGIYPCKPGGPNDYVYLLTSRANPEHWPRLLKLIGREELIGDARYDTPDARLQHEAEVDAIVTDWTRQRTKHEAMAQLSAVGVPAGAVLDSMELTSEPSFRQRGILQTMTHGERTMTMPTWPVRFDGVPAESSRRHCLASTPPKCWPTGSGSMPPRSRRCVGTASSEAPAAGLRGSEQAHRKHGLASADFNRRADRCFCRLPRPRTSAGKTGYRTD